MRRAEEMVAPFNRQNDHLGRGSQREKELKEEIETGTEKSSESSDL